MWRRMQGWYESNWVVDRYKRKRVPSVGTCGRSNQHLWGGSWSRIPHILKPPESIPTDNSPSGVTVNAFGYVGSQPELQLPGWELTDLKEPGSTPGRSISFCLFYYLTSIPTYTKSISMYLD